MFDPLLLVGLPEQGAHELDWRPEEYGARVGGGIPKILHHIFLDGEAEYAK